MPDHTQPPHRDDGHHAAVDALYRECMDLLLKSRELEMATRERPRPEPTQALAETEVRLRTTCKLTSALAWLSGQMAVMNGEMTAEEAPDFEPPPPPAPAAVDSRRENMSADLLRLEEAAEALLARAERLVDGRAAN